MNPPEVDLPCNAGHSQKHRLLVGIHKPKTINRTRRGTPFEKSYYELTLFLNVQYFPVLYKNLHFCELFCFNFDWFDLCKKESWPHLSILIIRFSWFWKFPIPEIDQKQVVWEFRIWANFRICKSTQIPISRHTSIQDFSCIIQGHWMIERI